MDGGMAQIRCDLLLTSGFASNLGSLPLLHAIQVFINSYAQSLIQNSVPDQTWPLTPRPLFHQMSCRWQPATCHSFPPGSQAPPLPNHRTTLCMHTLPHIVSLAERQRGEHMMMGGARTGLCLLLSLLLNDRGACCLQCLSLPVLSPYLPPTSAQPGFAHTSRSFLCVNSIQTAQCRSRF